jgi:hypothetical protein
VAVTHDHTVTSRFVTSGAALDLCRHMENCEFIQEREDGNGTKMGALTGWEAVVFQVEDEPPED